MTPGDDDDGATEPLDEAHLDLADQAIQRARAGQDPRLEALPPTVRRGVETALALERRLLGPGAAPAPAPQPRPPAPPGRGRDPWLGQTLSGCTLERLLGRGGMGAAYLARRADGLQVVVKLLPVGTGGGERLLERFRREAEALRRVRHHPNVVSVLGGSVAGEGQPHLVLEYVAGPSLEGLVRERGRLAPAEAARLALGVVRGLGVLHGHGLLHRDVKPANVVVGPDGRARLIDFGIAKDLFLSGLTEPGQLVGTAEYMSPEQWSGQAQDARADLFALGATLYHLLAGRPPFQGEGLDELMELATTGDFPPLAEVAPGTPPALERVVLGLLEPNPRFRYARAEQVAEDLERALVGRPPANVAALVRPAEEARPAERLPLAAGTRFVVGAGPRAEVQVAGPGVGAEHLEVTRDDAGFTVRDLRSAGGTWVGGARLTAPRPVEDGDELRLGGVRLLFSDPGGRARPPAWLDDLARLEQPDVVVSALARAGDPSVVAALVELLAPDPLAERSAEALLRAVGGADAPALLARRARLAQEARAAVPALLAQASGEALGADPVAWLAWLFQARPRLPRQVGPDRPARALRLTPALQGARPCAIVAQAADRGVLLVGRDERCHLRLPHPTVSRLHATVLRLHRRLALRDEGGPGGTRLDGAGCHVGFLDPGGTATVGDVALTVEGGEAAAPRDDGARVADPYAFQALEEARHPSALAGHVALLEVAPGLEAQLSGRVQASCADPGRAGQVERLAREALAARVARARAALTQALGRDEGHDAAAWRVRLQASGPPPGPVVCAGLGG